jgi:hypothetical protein
MRSAPGRRLLTAMLLTLAACGADNTVDLQVTVVVPPEVPSIQQGLLRLTLWRYDDRVADAAATPVDVHELNFTHGLAEADEFVMRVRGAVPGPEDHYITVRGFELAGGGEEYVLWDGIKGLGAPSRVVMRYVGEE